MNKKLTQKQLDQRFDNPIMKNQSAGNQFTINEDGEIELIGSFVGSDRFISFEEIVKKIKGSNKKIILNIGDSSTSGWNSDLVSINREQRKSKTQNTEEIFPLFSYDTYSDILRKSIGKNFYIINAGVPTHTSLNSFRRLKKMVNKFKEDNINIDYATVYVGNNDCACNSNVEEKNRKSIFNFIVKFLKKDKIQLRTTVKDYEKNIKSIIKLCKQEKIKIIIIKPLVPIYWEPGRRVKRKKFTDWDEEDKNIQEIKIQPGGNALFNSYKKSLNLWKKGIDDFEKGNITLSIQKLQQAKELDFITPRIKQEYEIALENLIVRYKIPFIDIDIPRDKNDCRNGEGYFCDYCHPIEKTNKIITDEIINKLKSYGEKNVK